MEIKTQKCTGALKVSENVIIDIASNVIREAQGATEYKMINPLNIEKNSSVTVTFKEGAAYITALINVEYGYKAQVVAETIQKKIKNSVQDMTGIMVAKVNVKIASLA